MRSKILGTIEVCTDCLHAHANGEFDPYRPDDLPAPLSAIPSGQSVTLGTDDHVDDCTEAHRREYGCGCDELGFSTYRCDGCGDTHHGDRFGMTLWQD